MATSVSNAFMIFYLYRTRYSKRNWQFSFKAFGLTILNVFQAERRLSDAQALR